MKGLSKESASWHEVGEAGDSQRIDNYLVRLLKGVPKSHIYRILRSGEVRVNSGRVSAEHRLKAGDRVRLPPLARAPDPVDDRKGFRPARVQPVGSILFEDDALLVLDKPAGVAVHGGSGVSLGLIEQLRRERPQASFLELVHRLDRDTSGVLVLAKKRSALTNLHAQLREGRAHKFYLALVAGRWNDRKRIVREPLRKYALASGERRVRVEEQGRPALSVVQLQRAGAEASLVEVEIRTGRTHQIRVHLAHLGHPIAGDDKYGDYAANRALARRGLRRMFLHACRLIVAHPLTGAPVTFEAPLPHELAALVDALLAPHVETV